MKISFGLSGGQYALLQESLDGLSQEAMAAISTATRIAHERPSPAVTYEFVDCEDVVGSEIRERFETLENDSIRRGDHLKAITCNQAALAIRRALVRKRVEVWRL